jgi:outer membrane protein OmpA-like peptidoglycan-associated protein
MFASLLNTLDKHTVGGVAHAIGQPEESVSHGMETSIASLLGGMASKSQDTGILQKVLDTVSGTGGDISWSQMANAVTNPTSSVMTAGKRVLSTLFGNKETAIVNGISRSSGLTTPGSALTLLSMCAPVVMSFLTRKMRDGGLTINNLGNMLQRESGVIRNALPASINDVFWPDTATAAAPSGTVREDVSPVIAQTVRQERSHSSWLPALALAIIGLGFLWFLTHARRPPVNVAVIPHGTANRIALPPAPTTTVNAVCTVPADMNLPAGGVAARMLAYVQNPGNRSASPTWFNADQLQFDTAKTGLRSDAQLANIAAVMKACPNTHLTIAGYTDNVGNENANQQLSTNRANSVASRLVGDGVSRDRITCEGYGEKDPIADNDTENGRAQNRRVAMQLTGE